MDQASIDFDAMGFGPYPVTEVAHDFIVMPDCTKLAVKYWLPVKKSCPPATFRSLFHVDALTWMTQLYEGKGNHCGPNVFPVILEYLPYYKDGFTAKRDHARHPWFSSHGFVCARLEIRGTGASEGYYYDEYSNQELEDCVAAISWFSEQIWCNGNIGMYGKSWGGFNGLQVAYKQPQGLKAVVSIYSTDNRYTDDIHYQGGTVIGNGMLSWANVMFGWNARPPPPKHFSSNATWRKAWLSRLEETSQSWLVTWLSSQSHSDSYWKHGSISQDYKRIGCPVLVIGGLADGYTNGALRMAALLNDASRAVVGPWSHDWPDTCPLGPNIDFLGLCLSWFSAYLQTSGSNAEKVLSLPRLSLFVRESFYPDQIYGCVPGAFIAIPEWATLYKKYVDAKMLMQFDSSDFLQCLYFGNDYALLNKAPQNETPCVQLSPHPLQGARSGEWLTYGFEKDMPGNQEESNKASCCWVSDILVKEILLVGFSTVFLALEAVKSGRYAVQVNICDIAADGSSTLVTRGCLNLCQVGKNVEDGWIDGFPAQTVKIVPVELKAVGHIFRAGNRICVSVMPSYFPMMWPAVHSHGLLLHPGRSSFMYQSLPSEDLCQIDSFGVPKCLLQLESKRLSEALYFTDMKKENGCYKYIVKDDSGLVSYPTLGVEFQDVRKEVYCTNKDVSSASAEINSEFHMNFQITHSDIDNDHVGVEIKTHQMMTGDAHCFRIMEDLDIKVDGEKFFSQAWRNCIPRKYV